MSETDFFRRYQQQDVSIRGVPGKAPMFFRELRMMGAIFAVPRPKALAALPGSAYKPLTLPSGLALAALHCMEYVDSDIGPYNEVSLAIALRRGWLPVPSLLKAANALRSQVFHAYVASLPVTTEVALHGGIDFFNFPKFLADISFRETSSHRICTVRDPVTKDLILEFEGRRLATWSCAPKDQNLLTLYTYPEIGGKTRRARLLIDQRERGSCLLRGASLRAGAHPRSAPFRALELGRPLHYVYAPRCRAVLFEPERG